MKKVLFAVAVFLGALSFALPAQVQAAAKYELQLQTAVPNQSMYFKIMQRLADRIELLSQGEIKVTVLADGAVVKAFEILDAVSNGVINGGQAWTHYWSGKHPAGVLFAAPTAGLGIGLDQMTVMSWIWEGDGQKLVTEYYQDVLQANVVPYLVMPMGPEPFGWFKKKYNSVAELKKAKFRSPPGVPAESFKEMGMPVVSMPGGDIIPAAQRGVIDAAEWISPGDDLLLGFSDIWKHYYIQGLHQAISIGDVIINRDWYNELPKHLQNVLDQAMFATIADSLLMTVSINGAALEKLVKEEGVIIEDTPLDYYEEYMAAADKVNKKYAAKNVFYKKVYDSMEAWAKTMVPYQMRMNGVSYNMGKTAMEQGKITDYKK